VAAVAREPLAATPAKPVARPPAIATPAAKPKPALATENGALSGPLPRPDVAARPVARPSRSPLSDPALQ
jgi:hypothetical protein